MELADSPASTLSAGVCPCARTANKKPHKAARAVTTVSLRNARKRNENFGITIGKIIGLRAFIGTKREGAFARAGTGKPEPGS
jgi:hypothetical protein